MTDFSFRFYMKLQSSLVLFCAYFVKSVPQDCIRYRMNNIKARDFATIVLVCSGQSFLKSSWARLLSSSWSSYQMLNTGIKVASMDCFCKHNIKWLLEYRFDITNIFMLMFCPSIWATYQTCSPFLDQNLFKMSWLALQNRVIGLQCLCKLEVFG